MSDDTLERFNISEICKVVHELSAVRPQVETVAELFAPGRFTERCHTMDLVPGIVFDLRTNWNSSSAARRRRCWQQLEKELPEVIIGSPLHLPFSQSKDDQSRRTEGLNHLQCIFSVYT